MLQRLLFFAILAVTFLSHHATAQPEILTNVVLQPDETIQTFLRTLLSSSEQEMFSGTKEEFRVKLSHLQDMAGGDTNKLVSQLLCFSIHAETMREAMLPGVLVQQLGISKESIVRGLLPYLDAKDARTREKSRNWLGEVESNPLSKVPDFTPYEIIIRERKKDIPQGLIEHMYATSPDATLLNLAIVYLDKDEAKTLVNQVKAEDEAQAVARLSKRPEWWAKLYATEKMKQNPKLRDPELMKQLKKSRNPVVSATIQEIEDGKK